MPERQASRATPATHAPEPLPGRRPLGGPGAGPAAAPSPFAIRSTALIARFVANPFCTAFATDPGGILGGADKRGGTALYRDPIADSYSAPWTGSSFRDDTGALVHREPIRTADRRPWSCHTRPVHRAPGGPSRARAYRTRPPSEGAPGACGERRNRTACSRAE